MTDQSKFEATDKFSSTSDQLMNVLHDGIFSDISFNLKHGRNRAALILIFSGIDAMASLEKNDTRIDGKERFVNWVSEYMHFTDWPEAGLELYGSRCGLLHTYGPVSTLSEKGNVRLISYTSSVGQNVMQSTDLVLLSVERLTFEFFGGLAKYLEALASDSSKREKAMPRIKLMFREFDLDIEIQPSHEDIPATQS